MPVQSAALLRKVDLGRAALSNAIVAAAEEYANGGNRAEPIVRQHFTAGNEGRYGWPPLSDDYAEWKSGGTTKTAGGVAFLGARQARELAGFMAGLAGIKGAARKAARAQKVAELRAGRAASRADKAASIGKGQRGAGLPMLVLSGRLRDAVAGGRAMVQIIGPGRVRIRWSGLPEYATYLHDGTAKMPKRSPIEPNAQDKAQVIASAQRYLSAAIVTGRADVGGLAAGRARVR